MPKELPGYEGNYGTVEDLGADTVVDARGVVHATVHFRVRNLAKT